MALFSMRRERPDGNEKYIQITTLRTSMGFLWYHMVLTCTYLSWVLQQLAWLAPRLEMFPLVLRWTRDSVMKESVSC